MVCNDVDVVHVGSGGRVRRGGFEASAGCGECLVESEREGCSGKWTAHGYSTVCCVRLCLGLVQSAIVCGFGSDPWSEEWFVLWVVSLNGLYDGRVVEVGEGRGDIDRKDGIVWVLIE